PKPTSFPNQTSAPPNQKTNPKPAEQTATPIPVGTVNSIEADIKVCLSDIYNRPFIPKTQRLSELFPSSTSHQQKVSQECLDQGYITEHDVHAGGQSGRTKLWKLTNKGLALIGLPRRPLPGKGDLLHQFLQFKVSEKVNEWGMKPRIEFFRRGKNVDVGIVSQQSLIALEIATTAGNEITNLLKDIDAGFHKVVVLPINETIRKDIQRTVKRQVSPVYAAKVLVMTISKFLDSKSPPW
ncbi:MAG: hypothetical protein KC964_30050, partial [Candidatus Omnitrophica bacterium]|nr:hypothetical protein [Candidatus Omnitrophota bacterium]